MSLKKKPLGRIVLHSESFRERIEEEEIEYEIKKNQRQRNIEAFDDWFYFYSSKITGSIFLGVGLTEMIAPSLLAIVLAPPFTPFTLVGAGLAFLGGAKSISLIKRILKTVSEDN